MLRCRCSSKHTADKLYEILGWLNDEPIEVTVDRAENTEPAQDALRSIQMGDATYYKVVSEAVFHLCRRAGVSKGSMKTLFHALRVQAVRFAQNDLEHAPSLGHTDSMAIMLGVRQMTYSALKIHDRMGHATEGGGGGGRPGETGLPAGAAALSLLQLTVADAEFVQQLLARKQKVDEYPVLQSKLSLGVTGATTRQADLFPFFDHFLVGEDDLAGRGAKTSLFTGMPVDLLPQRTEHKAKTLDDAVKASRNLLQRLFVLKKYAAHCRLSSRLSLMMMVRCFYREIPVPLGPSTRLKRRCVWHDTEMLHAQQQAVVALMLSLAQQLMTCVAAVKREHDVHGLMITVVGCMAAICDAVLRSPCKDLEGRSSGMKQALDQGFALSTDTFVKQAEVFPVFSASLLTLRAEVLDYFTELPSPGQGQAMFSWELYNYDPNNNDRENVNFAKAVCKSMNLEMMADKDFVYESSLVQTSLFPEFGGYRDVAFIWKYMLNPHSEPGYCAAGRRIEIKSLLRSIAGSMPGTGLAFPSLTRPSHYTGKSEVFSENDVLHLHTLPDFDGSLGQRDSELLLSYLTVPYLRIPLLLDFIASDYRMYALKNETLRDCLECCLSECGRFLPSAIWSHPERCLPKQVPSEDDALVATSHGLLLNELQHSPRGVLEPLQRLVEWAACAAHSVQDDSFPIILYVCRLSARVSSFSKHLLQCWLGEIAGFEVWQDCLKGTQANIKVLEDLSGRLQASLLAHTEATAESEFAAEGEICEGGSSKKVARMSLSGQLIARLHEIEAKSRLYLAGGERGAPSADSGSEFGSGKVDDTLLIKYVCTAADIHAHLTLIYRASATFTVDSCLAALSSIFFLSVRHTWNAKNLESKLSETELTAALDDVRCKAFHFMEKLAASENGKDDFVKICQGVYQAVMSSENENPNWCKVQEKRGVYVVSFDPLQKPRISALGNQAKANLNPQTRTVVFDGGKSTLISSDYCPKGEKGYYEIEMLGAGLAPRYGFVSTAFSAHATARFDGVGDDHHSWAVDGVRKKWWHKSVKEDEDVDDVSKLLKSLFALLDKNDDNMITLDEFKTFLRVLLQSSVELPKPQYKRGDQVQALYSDNGRWYDARIISTIMGSSDTYELAWSDGDPKDTIKHESNIRKAVTGKEAGNQWELDPSAFGERMSDDKVREVFAKLDKNGDNKISESEFVEWMEDYLSNQCSVLDEVPPSFRYKWVNSMILMLKPDICSYDCSWRKGDVIGLACDLENNQIHVSVNGSFNAPNGLIFELSSDDVHNGLFAAFTDVSGKLRYNLGQTSFKHAPPSSEYKGFVHFDATESRENRAGATMQNDCRVPMVADSGQYSVELDLQCLELRVSGGVLRGLDNDIVKNDDVRAVLGNAVQTLQCIELRDSEVCKERKIVGTKTEVEICIWSGVKKLQPRDMDREYAPLELGESELWIADLFEPIRSTLFAPPQCKEEVMFFLSDEMVPMDATCVYMCAAHPKLHGAWFMVMLTKDLGTVDVWLCDSYGGQYWPSPIYTSNRIFSHFSFDPDVDDRKVAWETWGRHEAAHENFAEFRKELDPGTNNGFPKTCTVIRSIQPPDGEGGQKRRELFIPRRFLSGLIPEGLVHSHIFWQDMQTPTLIRGYEDEKEVSWADLTSVAITIHLEKMDEDELEVHQGVTTRMCIEGKLACNATESNSSNVISPEMRKIFRQRCEMALQKIAAAVLLHPNTNESLENEVFSPLENGLMPLSALKAGVMALELTISESDLTALFDYLRTRGSESVSKENWLNAIAGANWEEELRAQGLDLEHTCAKIAGRGIDVEKLKSLRFEVQMKKKGKVIRATGMNGVVAKVAKVGEANNTEVLLNALQAPTGSALWSLIRTISRVEHASHVLVWGVPAPADSDAHRITRVELTRLKASFSVRRHTALDDSQRMLLFSADLPGFYIVDFDELPSQAKELVQGVPQMLVLCSLQHEWLLMVPNSKAVRPQVRPRPFSCEVVFDHDDNEWKKNSEVEYFTFQVHQSGLSLVPKGLASGFYLLVLKFLGRDYQQACAMISSISTDAALTKQEQQILQLLSQIASDQHPDALACRVKIELALADCPVNLPWDIRQVAGLYFTKLRHVSAGVRLSEREEYSLIRLCKDTTKIQKIIATGAARYSKESVEEWCKILCIPQYRKAIGSAKVIQDAEAFATSLLDMVYAKGQRLDRTKLLSFLQRIGQQVALVWACVLNREKYLNAKSKGEYSAQACFAARKRTSGWQLHRNTRILKAESKDFNNLVVEYSMPEKTIRGVDAISIAIQLFEYEDDNETEFQFMLIYDIFSERVKVKLLDSPQHTFASLLFYLAISDCRGGNLFASILSTMCHNPHLFSGPDSGCPRLVDDRINYDSSRFRTDPTPNEPRVPLRVLLEAFAAHIKAQESNLKQSDAYKVPTTAMKSARTVTITDGVKLVDECPPCQVRDFQISSRVLCGRPAWTEILADKLHVEHKLLAVYDERVLDERPLLSTAMDHVMETKRKIPSETVPFDVDVLLKGSSDVEKAMIDRLQDDCAKLHAMAQSKDGVAYELTALAGRETAIAQGSEKEIGEALANIMELSRRLQQLKAADMDFFSRIQTLVVEIANGQFAHSKAERSPDILQLKLLRISGHRPLMTFPFLLLTLLSSLPEEWQLINPFISQSSISAASDLLCLALLHAIRASSTNLALAQLHSLRTELDKLRSQRPADGGSLAVKNAEIVLKQMSSALGDLLGSRRVYFSEKKEGGMREFKPHFLVFEFQSSMMLRVRQIEIVKEICDAMEHPKDGQRAVVKQMIMGSGKTTV
jgi:hypothetical protein